MVGIERLWMDYEAELCGTDRMPQLGWVIACNRRGARQEAYHLQIALNEEFTELVYDSGKESTDQSVHIKPEGVSLLPLTRYFVRVKVWVGAEESIFCKPASFVTGLLKSENWQGDFISAETEADAGNSKGTYVRKEFTVSKKIKNAYAAATALGIYNLYLNGKKVGTDELTPGWTSYKKHLCYQTYDVTDMLKEGENAVGAILGAGWYKGAMGFTGACNHYGKQTALLVNLLIRYEDGTQEWIYTDTSWKGTDAPVVFAEIYDGEIYDARKEIDGWCEAGLDESDWNAAEKIDFEKTVLTAQAAGKVSVMDEVPVKRLFTTPQGDMVLDFGQNMTGRITVKAKGKAGDRVHLECFEVLDADGNVYLDNLRGAKESFTYIWKEDGEVTCHPSFTFMGFQYAKITEFPGEPKPENFTAHTLHSKMEQTGTFFSSMPELNQLWHNILWGMKGNFLDVPTDCPQRNERLGWTGDAQIFCRTASYLMNTDTFYTKWLRDVAADQRPDGGVPDVVPDILTPDEKIIEDWLLSQGTYGAAAWADVAVILPWTMYLTFGDAEILETQYDSMKAWIDFMVSHSKDYFWSFHNQYGDWVALDASEGSYHGATPDELTCMAYFAYSTGLFVKAARALGKTETADEYEKLYSGIVNQFRKTFFNADGTMTVQTQTAHIVALYFGLVSEENRAGTVEGLKRLLEKHDGHLVTGFIGTPYFCHALSENGCIKEAFDLLMKDDFPSWLYQVKMGATTIWEHWDGLKPDGTMWSADMNSFNHYAYGAIGEWMFRVIGGIEADEKAPGYRRFRIQPHIGGGLTHAKAEYQSVYGKISSSWELADGCVTLKAEIPVNTEAEILLDGAVRILEADDVAFAPNENGTPAGYAGAGSYTITYEAAQ